MGGEGIWMGMISFFFLKLISLHLIVKFFFFSKMQVSRCIMAGSVINFFMFTLTEKVSLTKRSLSQPPMSSNYA